MITILEKIIQFLTGGLAAMASGIGDGLKALIEALFLNVTTVEGVTTYDISTFGAVVAIFAGISLAVGLSRKVVSWVASLGGSRM